ncbi:hypothetical protein RvY_02508 [Ramazzottius varieornatus]|uniref:Uncharacterized protein n=1 Tax=Ramazzottius varieornatus TaxID=947166 RepID=A0A1D1UJZ7_RAMVA|nr:hypothetical protein RvY_02508 [Ramazzottius varieornatus]
MDDTFDLMDHGGYGQLGIAGCRDVFPRTLDVYLENSALLLNVVFSIEPEGQKKLRKVPSLQPQTPSTGSPPRNSNCIK